MVVLGMDISTYCGLARTDYSGEIVGKCINFPELKGFDRLEAIRKEVVRIVEAWNPDKIIIEDFAIYHKSSVVVTVSCGIVVRAALHARGFAWWEIPPTSLKKWTTGKGNASKAEMAVAVKARWGYASPSDDIIDAVALAKLGMHLVQFPQDAPKGLRVDGKQRQGVLV